MYIMPLPLPLFTCVSRACKPQDYYGYIGLSANNTHKTKIYVFSLDLNFLNDISSQTDVLVPPLYLSVSGFKRL